MLADDSPFYLVFSTLLLDSPDFFGQFGLVFVLFVPKSFLMVSQSRFERIVRDTFVLLFPVTGKV